jgi:hypothetical protein
MAEYLCEEDMSTGEYISRDVALRQLNATCLATDCNNYNGVMCRACAYADAMDLIEAIPAADVQPVDRWTSIEESKPEDMQQVLAVVDGDVREAFYNAGCFIGSNFYRSINEVKWWQPLPEPPKDGDTEC